MLLHKRCHIPEIVLVKCFDYGSNKFVYNLQYWF